MSYQALRQNHEWFSQVCKVSHTFVYKSSSNIYQTCVSFEVGLLVWFDTCKWLKNLYLLLGQKQCSPQGLLRGLVSRPGRLLKRIKKNWTHYCILTPSKGKGSKTPYFKLKQLFFNKTKFFLHATKGFKNGTSILPQQNAVLGCRTLNQRVMGSNPGEGIAWYLRAGYLKIHCSG
jgi:hypothetical protein